MRRRFFLVANPGAGLTGSPLVDAVSEALKLAGAEVACVRPESIEGARRAASEAAASDRYDAIVAAGGDGTIRQLAGRLMGTGVPMGIIPCGTANVLAHEIGLQANVDAIARTLLEGHDCLIACARANNEPFLLMAGAGFDGRVVAALNHSFKAYFGKAAYAGPMLGALVRPVDLLSVTVDGRRYEANWAVISNARHYGGRFVLTPRTDIHERGLEAILFKARSRAVLIGQLMCLARGTLHARSSNSSDVEMLACSRVTVTSRRPVPAQIDGDAFGYTPLEIDEGVAQLRLIVPPRSRRAMHR